MLSVNNIYVHFTGEYILEGISFLVTERDRIGLVGKNGAGKTTLLNVIAGEVEPEKGNVSIASGKRIGYLKQEMNPRSELTIYDAARSAFDEILQIEQQIIEIQQKISKDEGTDQENHLKLLSRLEELNDRFKIHDGHLIDESIEKVLRGLGFERSDFGRSMNEFSSGWQMRVELARILLRMPDILLLDEPTNHLDIESIQWLEEFLIDYPGAVIVVSHDRAFLDNVTNRTIEITLGKIYDYRASYSDYEQLKAQRLEREIASYNNQQQQIAQIERFIERFRYKSTKARQVQSRIKMLERMEKIEIEPVDNSAIRFRFPPAPHSGKVTVRVENLSKSYGDKLVLKNVNFQINRGEKVAFVGRNGEGKTTLSKIIVGELSCEGLVELGYQVKIGYYAQNQHEMLDPEKTVFETIDDAATGEMRTKTKALLGTFLFRGDDLEKKVKVLSGGEKARLSLARMLLTPVNLLVLDEPTNHLDMRSKDILKTALIQFDGTLIVVSHDRDFLTGLTEKVFEFRNKTIREYIGDVNDFIKERKLENLRQLEKSAPAVKNIPTTSSSSGKLEFERKKQIERELRKFQNQIARTENTIEYLEKEIHRLDQLLAQPDDQHPLVQSGEIFTLYQNLKEQLDSEINRWEMLHRELEDLQKKFSQA